MTIAVVVNITRENAYEVACEVIEQLSDLSVRVIVEKDHQDKFSHYKAEFMKVDDAVRECDICIAVGGDGTMIHSAHYVAKYGKAILGINAGRLGFLAGLEKEELNLLSSLIDGNYSVENRMLLKVSHFESSELMGEFNCFNDVIITRKELTRICEIDASCNGRPISEYKGDGVVVATPTGSTAYSLAAGGPVIDTSLECIVVTPLCPHTLLSRSMIFCPDSKIEMKIRNASEGSMVFSCDGKKGVEIGENSRIVITKSDTYVKIIKIKADSFSEILSSKLIERSGRI